MLSKEVVEGLVWQIGNAFLEVDKNEEDVWDFIFHYASKLDG